VQVFFRVPAVPVAQPRPRAVIRGSHAGVVGAATKHPIYAFKAAVMAAFRSVYQGPPVDDCDIALTLIFVMPRAGKCRGEGRQPYRVKRNDFDNLAKSVADALNQLAWADDGLIHAAYVERWYAAADEAAHVDVTIRRLDPVVAVKPSRKSKQNLREHAVAAEVVK